MGYNNVKFYCLQGLCFGHVKYTETKSAGQKTWDWKGASHKTDTAHGTSLIVAPRHIIISKVSGQK